MTLDLPCMASPSVSERLIHERKKAMTEFQIDDVTCSHCDSTIVRAERPLGPQMLAAAIHGARCTPASA
jgi:hypothetical protein